jgi:hypothetical protein
MTIEEQYLKHREKRAKILKAYGYKPTLDQLIIWGWFCEFWGKKK